MYLLTYDHGGYILWGDFFKEKIEDAISWLDKYPKFKIGLDNEAFAYDKYNEIDSTSMEMIKNALKKYHGRFAIGSCTYGQPLSVFINEESNVRQLTYAIRCNLKHFGVTPNVYAISEHALHSQVPQLVLGCNYVAAMMRTHFMMYGYNPTYNEPYIIWQGDDLSEIPTVPTYTGEGNEFAVTTMDNWVLTRWPNETDMSLEDFYEKFKHLNPLIASRYDDIVLRCEKLVQHVENKNEYEWILLEEIPKKFGTPTNSYKPSANEFVVRMPWGYCGNQLLNKCREAEIYAGLAERADALAFLSGRKSQENLMESSWKNLLLAQHHDIQICGLIKEGLSYVEESINMSKAVLSNSLHYITTKFACEKGNYVLVFNPHSFAVHDNVSAEISLKPGKLSFFAVYKDEITPCFVEPLEIRKSKTTRCNISFTATVEPLSFQLYKIIGTDDAPENNIPIASSNTIVYRDYKITVDEYGITGLWKNDKEYIKSDKGQLFSGIINGEKLVSKCIWAVRSKRGNLQVTCNGAIGSLPFTFEMVFKSDRIDCHAEFDYNGEKIGSTIDPTSVTFKKNTNGFIHEDKLCFVLNTVFKNLSGVRDLPFLVEETDDAYIQGNYWTGVSNGFEGIAIFNKGNMCTVKQGNKLLIPIAYTNTYVWGDRQLFGKHTYDFAITLFENDWKCNDIHKRAYTYEYPLQTLAFYAETDQSGYNENYQPIKIKADKNILLSALYVENNKPLIRLYEYLEEKGIVNLECGEKAITETNLLGERSENTSFEFTGHKIRTYEIN